MNRQNAQPLRVLEGMNARLELYPDRVMIHRTDILGQLLPQVVLGDRIILLDQIESVGVYISRFLNASRVHFVITSNVDDSAKLTFDSKYLKPIHEIKDMIEGLKSQLGSSE